MAKALSQADRARYRERGARIAKALDHAELTQSRLAELVGVDQSYISRMVQGAVPGEAYLRAIARHCGVPLRYITEARGWHPSDSYARRPKTIRPLPLGHTLTQAIQKRGHGCVELSPSLATVVLNAVNRDAMHIELPRGGRLLLLALKD